MRQPHANTDNGSKASSKDNGDNDFILRLMAIAESDRPQSERIDDALKLCARQAANIRAKHGVLDSAHPTREDLARVRRDLGALHDEMIRRETVYPDSSVTQNVLRASIRVFELEQVWNLAGNHQRIDA